MIDSRIRKMNAVKRARGLLADMMRVGHQCPAHGAGRGALQRSCVHGHVEDSAPDYAYEVASSTIRFGAGATREIGLDVLALKAKNVCVMTDRNIVKLAPFQQVADSLTKQNINFKVFDDVKVEPNEASFQRAIEFAKSNSIDAFVAVGGGSVMDTAKAANLYASNPAADFLDYVNAPIGKGLPVEHQLHPLIAVPTTAGTGSETTGTSVFDYSPVGAKTGISSRAIRPTLGIVDPLHLQSMPLEVATYSAFDVLCHALESYTAIPYSERRPRPAHPNLRPAYQGSNPISDVWSLETLRILRRYMHRAILHNDPMDTEAQSQMHLASTYAGVGFGNAGCHLCHGMSYPISSQVRKYRVASYNNSVIVPHGLSVVLNAPAVFQFTAPACPERHLLAAEILGADVTGVRREDSGRLLADTVRKYMKEFSIPDGLHAVGYTHSDIERLVEGTLPQHRLTKLSPRPQSRDDLAGLFEKSLSIY